MIPLNLYPPWGEENKFPTFTFLNLAGEHPWLVGIFCAGSPLPQLGVPQISQYFSLAMASHEFQNSTVFPE